jgi:septal ring factor EnvC (AmiA/AmiB activator)
VNAGRPVLALVLAVVAGGVGAPVARSDDRAERLAHLHQAIEEGRARVAAFEHQQRGLLDALDAIDRAASEIEQEAARNAQELAQAEAARREAEARMPALQARLAGTRAAMARRVVALYETGEMGPAQLLFASTTLRDLLERVQALSVLLERDRLLVTRSRAEERAVDAARRSAEASAAQVEQAQAALAERRRQLDTERSEKERLLASVRSDRARERAALAELETAARALEDTLARLGDTTRPQPVVPTGPPFPSLRGQLPAPVDAPIVRRFGRQVDAQFHTEVFHKGVDFGAPRGAPVRAVAAGVVRFAGWFRGYGRMVILDHGHRFFTVHGHLDQVQVAVGDTVAAGAVIGTVGDTGSLGGPDLYFEIRQGGDAVDPVAWLRPEARVPDAARRDHGPGPG